MRALRSQLGVCSWVAVFALALQLALSFGHIHPSDLFPGGTRDGAATSHVAGDPGPSGPAGQADHDAPCSICAAMALTGSLVVPQPPTVGVPMALEVPWSPDVAVVPAAGGPHRQFQARAPPA